MNWFLFSMIFSYLNCYRSFLKICLTVCWHWVSSWKWQLKFNKFEEFVVFFASFLGFIKKKRCWMNKRAIKFAINNEHSSYIRNVSLSFFLRLNLPAKCIQDILEHVTLDRCWWLWMNLHANIGAINAKKMQLKQEITLHFVNNSRV